MNEVATQGIPAAAATTPGVDPGSVSESRTQASPKAPKFESKVEETLWRVNNPSSEEVAEEASINAIIDKAQENAGKSSKEANSDGRRAEQTETPQQELPEGQTAKEKYLFEGKEVELDPKDRTRYIQKGMLLDKKGYELAKADKALKTGLAEVNQTKQELAQLLATIKQNPFQLVLETQGPEAARKAAEQFLLPHVQREMMDPHERAILDANERAEQAEARIAQWEQQRQQQEVETQTETFKSEFANTILEALKQTGIPKNDFSAREMAMLMQVGLDKGIQYTPPQLAELVKQNNIERTSAINAGYVAEIEAGLKSNDTQRILRAGEALSQLHGEKVMYAIGKFYVAKSRSAQPQQPRQVLDTPKTKTIEPGKPREGRHYQTEDEVKAERMRRVQMLEQGIDPGVWK